MTSFNFLSTGEKLRFITLHYPNLYRKTINLSLFNKKIEECINKMYGENTLENICKTVELNELLSDETLLLTEKALKNPFLYNLAIQYHKIFNEYINEICYSNINQIDIFNIINFLDSIKK